MEQSAPLKPFKQTHVYCISGDGGLGGRGGGCGGCGGGSGGSGGAAVP